MVGADVPGGPSPARGVRQPSRAWAWGAGGRAGRAPLPMSESSYVRANQRGRPVRTPRAEGGSGTSRAGPWVGGCGFGRGWGVGRRRRRARPRQARPSCVAEVQETRDFTSEQFRRGDTRRVGARSTRAALGAGRPSRPGAGPGRDTRGPPVWPRCRRRGISRRSSSAGAIRGASAREVPAPPSARDVQADPAQGPAATSAALPCGRGCRGRGISRRSSSAGSIRGAAAREVPAPPSARDVQAGSAQGPAATSAALPCRRGAGDAGFHVGAVPK